MKKHTLFAYFFWLTTAVNAHLSCMDINLIELDTDEVEEQERQEIFKALTQSLRDHSNANTSSKEKNVPTATLIDFNDIQQASNNRQSNNDQMAIDEQLARSIEAQLRLQEDEQIAQKIYDEQSKQSDQAIQTNNKTKKTATKQRTRVNPHVECIKAVQQKEATCGMHAAINALAINLLLAQEKPVTEKSVAELNEQLQIEWLWEVDMLNKMRALHNNNKSVKYNDLSTADIKCVIERIKEKNPLLSTLKLFFLDNHMQWAGTVDNYSPEQTKRQDACEIAIQEFKQNQQNLISFICNTGGHWVTVCAIKVQGKDPHLYYMDSVNSPNPTSAGPFFAFVINKLF